jgi:hypothetical protein
MQFETSRTIYAAIRRSRHAELRKQLVDAAVRYARIRTDYRLTDPTTRADMEDGRTRAHNVLIDACNILARAMQRDGEDIGWRTQLTQDRKIIGDFACHLHALLGIEGR